MAERELRALEDALQADNAVRITEAIGDVVDALSASRRRRVSLEALASEVADAREADANTTTAARSFLTASSQADQTGLGVLTAAFSYVDGEASAAEMLSVVERAVEEHEAASAAETELREQKAGVELPALLGLTPPDDVELPTSGSTTVEATVENLGGAPASSVTVRAESDIGVSASPSDFGTIEADTERRLTLTLSGDSAGTADVTLEVSGDGVSTESTFSVVVVDAETYLRQGRSLLVQMREQIESLSSTGGDGNGGSGTKGNGSHNGNGPSNKLDVAIGKLDDLRDAIERGRPNETAIDNRIAALVTDVEAFQKQMGAKHGERFPEEAAAALRYNADQVISNLESAKKAAL